jgi:CRISPR/Cas system CSM-associated protein Csm3 (group 7 of RAMP superfamily)
MASSLKGEERPLLEDITKQRSEDVTENISLCVIVISKV